jgi:hypothetical protein
MEQSKSKFTPTKPVSNIQKIISQLNAHYRYMDNPQAKRLIIPKDKVFHEDDDKTLFNATMVYETDYVSKKTHVVHVQFHVDSNFMIKKDTLKYA